MFCCSAEIEFHLMHVIYVNHEYNSDDVNCAKNAHWENASEVSKSVVTNGLILFGRHTKTRALCVLCIRHPCISISTWLPVCCRHCVVANHLVGLGHCVLAGRLILTATRDVVSPRSEIILLPAVPWSECPVTSNVNHTAMCTVPHAIYITVQCNKIC